MKDDKPEQNEEDVISRSVFRNSGKKGGERTAKRGKEFYQKIGKKGMESRWKDNKQKGD